MDFHACVPADCRRDDPLEIAHKGITFFNLDWGENKTLSNVVDNLIAKVGQVPLAEATAEL